MGGAGQSQGEGVLGSRGLSTDLVESHTVPAVPQERKHEPQEGRIQGVHLRLREAAPKLDTAPTFLLSCDFNRTEGAVPRLRGAGSSSGAGERVMGGGPGHVDRPTGNPNIESGAVLFAQPVKGGGGHVGGPVKEPEGACEGGRAEGDGSETTMLHVSVEADHGRWTSTNSAGPQPEPLAAGRKFQDTLPISCLWKTRYHRTWSEKI